MRPVSPATTVPRAIGGVGRWSRADYAHNPEPRRINVLAKTVRTGVILVAVMLLGNTLPALADPLSPRPGPANTPAQAPAPVGVFGADTPPKHKFVFSLLASAIQLRGNRIGERAVSAPYIIANVVSPDTPAGSHLLRMVPSNSEIETESLAVAYGLGDALSLLASTSLVQKDVRIRAYQGLAGTTELGSSVGATSGLGDTTIAAIGRVYQDRTNRLNLTVGLVLPTGSTTRTMAVLVPDGTRPDKRAFYAMQPGAGTVDLLPGVAYSGISRAWSWGASYRARLPLDRNAPGWRYGDLHEVNAWVGYSLVPGLETTMRLNASTQGAIGGEDAVIKGFAQGSDPAFYGGRQACLYLGAIVSGRFVGAPRAQFGIEAGAPFYQDLNGPQLSRSWQLNLAIRIRR